MSFSDSTDGNNNNRTYTVSDTSYFIFFATLDLLQTTVVAHGDNLSAEIIVNFHPVNDQSTVLDLIDIDGSTINNNTMQVAASVIRDLSSFGDTYTRRIFANDAVLSTNSLHLGTGTLSMDAATNSLMFQPGGTKKYRLARANQIDDGGLQPNTIVRVESSGEINIMVQQNSADPISVFKVTTAGEVTIRNSLLFANNNTDETSLKWKLQLNDNGQEMYLMKRGNDHVWYTVNSWN